MGDTSIFDSSGDIYFDFLHPKRSQSGLRSNIDNFVVFGLFSDGFIHFDFQILQPSGLAEGKKLVDTGGDSNIDDDDGIWLATIERRGWLDLSKRTVGQARTTGLAGANYRV